MKFRAKAIINAPVQKVWQALKDKNAYPIFDPSYIKIKGTIDKNNHLKIFVRDKKYQPKKVTVYRFLPNKRMIWKEAIIFHLLYAEQFFRLVPKDDFTSEIHIEAQYGGILLPLLSSFLPDKSESLKAMVRGLKKYVEAQQK